MSEMFQLVRELGVKLWPRECNTKSYKETCNLLARGDKEERETAGETIHMWIKAGVSNRISEIWREECYPFPNEIGGGRTEETEMAADLKVQPLRELAEKIKFLANEMVK